MLQLQSALEALKKISKTRLIADSGFYTSKPMGPQDQPDYTNAVALITTELAPLILLDELQSIEQQHGRVRHQRWAARTLDLDILLYGEEQINLPRLQVPHVGLCQRDFVYLPLLKIDPAIVVPGRGALQSIVNNLPQESKQYEATYQGVIG